MNNKLKRRLDECNIDIDDIIKILEESMSNSIELVVIYTSHMEGLGTQDSDFDIYVISSDIENHEPQIKTYSLNNISLDVEFWSYNYLNKLFKIPNSLSKNKDLLKLFLRLKIGESILSTKKGAEFKLCIDKININSMVAEQYMYMSNSIYEDAVALFDAEEYFSSNRCGRQALDYAVASFNALSGIPNLKDKWIPKIFIDNNGFNSTFYEEYINIQFYSNQNKENLRSLTDTILNLTQLILNECVFLNIQ